MRSSTAARKYVRQTIRQLICDGKQKWLMTQTLWKTVQIFLADFPDASYEDFVEAFGPPEHMAAEMLRDVSLQEIRETAGQEKRLRRMRTAGLIAAVICACAMAVFFYWEREYNPHTITTIVYESERDVPAQTKNGLQYGLSYQLDAEGKIIAAFDANGTRVEVDADGKPLQ